MLQKSEDWLSKTDEFYERTNFPNCLGAVDSKHIRMCEPDSNESLFHNNKNFLSALFDADYCCISIDVGAYGASSDCNIFKNSTFCKK